jgi:NAD(P)-dependent dehydrogenase (short-subunit alcohol dehydrogenase family)
VAGIDLSGRRAIVTGAASGIGVETARALAGAGADVTLAVRNVEAGRRTADNIAATTGVRARFRSGRTSVADLVGHGGVLAAKYERRSYVRASWQL